MNTPLTTRKGLRCVLVSAALAIVACDGEPEAASLASDELATRSGPSTYILADFGTGSHDAYPDVVDQAALSDDCEFKLVIGNSGYEMSTIDSGLGMGAYLPWPYATEVTTLAIERSVSKNWVSYFAQQGLQMPTNLSALQADGWTVKQWKIRIWGTSVKDIADVGNTPDGDARWYEARLVGTMTRGSQLTYMGADWSAFDLKVRAICD